MNNFLNFLSINRFTNSEINNNQSILNDLRCFAIMKLNNKNQVVSILITIQSFFSSDPVRSHSRSTDAWSLRNTGPGEKDLERGNYSSKDEISSGGTLN